MAGFRRLPKDEEVGVQGDEERRKNESKDPPLQDCPRRRPDKKGSHNTRRRDGFIVVSIGEELLDGGE